MKIELWILIDANEEYVFDIDPETLAGEFKNAIGQPKHPTRLLKVVIDVPAPVHVELTASVPAEPGNGTMNVS